MADEDMWNRVRKELATPWDWVAAGVGAAGGLGVTVSVGGADAGTSAGIGALAAVSARKAGAAAFRGRTLAKRAYGLLHLLEQMKKRVVLAIAGPATGSRGTGREAGFTITPTPVIPPELLGCDQIIEAVKRDLELWEKRVISHDQFESLLNQHTENYRKLP